MPDHLEPGGPAGAPPAQRLEVARTLSGTAVAQVAALVDRARGPSGQDPLGDQHRQQLQHGGGHGVTGLLLRDGQGALVGYAHLSEEHDSWGLRMLADAEGPWPPSAVRRTLLRAAVDEVAAGGGGPLSYWLSGGTPDEEAEAVGEGFQPGRELLQMRVGLPLDPGRRRGHRPVAVRPFRPGTDEEAWLAVNNRAFADHPEQGGWGLADLRQREVDPWFDPEGFLLHEEDGRLAASCWTKVHRDERPPLGEIFVISVDPAFHHHGLGRALTVAGLDWLAGRGLTVGMLYVDGANSAAVGLYRSLGFSVHHQERAMVRAVP